MLFLISQIVAPASAQLTPTPEPHGYRGASQTLTYQGAFADLMNEIDAFWAGTFQHEGVAYAPPNIFVVEQETATGCGVVRPEPNAFYCGLDRTIYLVPQFLVEQEQQFGDYAPIAVLSHEWGHHIQILLGVIGPTRKDFELQADCLMGAFTRYADEQALLDYGDFLEALSSAIDAGDDVFLPEDFPGAHGMAEDRVKALTKGYGGGPVTGCNLQLKSSTSDISDTSGQITERDERSGHDSGHSPLSTVILPLPETVPLNHAACFRIESDSVLSFDELADRLGGTDDARSHLQDWGWQASANRVFTCDSPPEGEAGWIDISLHLFADTASAQQAVDYFAAVRAAGSTLISAAPPAIGDHAAVLSGPATNGKEFTLYASHGPLLVRVTGVSSTGIPFINVLTVAQTFLSLPLPQARPQEQMAPEQGIAAYLPSTLPLDHADCFGIVDEGSFDFAAVVQRFTDVVEAEAHLEGLGWEEGAYRHFGCGGPPDGGAGWIDISVHRLRDPASAAAAVPFFVDSRLSNTSLEETLAPILGDHAAALTGPASNGTEYSLYVSSGSLLFRVIGVAPIGVPAADVQQVMAGLIVGSSNVAQGEGSSIAVPTLPPPTTVAEPIILPTSTAIPTATAVPTATTPPTATPRPILALPTPTSAPLPTATLVHPPALPPTPTPPEDAEALLERLLATPIPENLLVYSGEDSSPRLDEDSGHLGGLIGVVGIDTGGGSIITSSGISYSVYSGTREAEQEQILWQEGHRSWIEIQEDVSGPELGPNALMLIDADSNLAACSAVIGPVVVRVSAIGAPQQVHRRFVNEIVLGNCVGAVAHVQSLAGEGL